MNTNTIAIDFGASYTKIAFRPPFPPRTKGHFCEQSTKIVVLDGWAMIPSAVIQTDNINTPWFFGRQAAQMKGGGGHVLHSNWKAKFFSDKFTLESQEVKKIAEAFFSWLLERVQQSGVALNAPCCIRVAVPALRGMEEQCQALKECVRNSGWPEKIDIVYESKANSIGCFSMGRNVVTVYDYISYMPMFGYQKEGYSILSTFSKRIREYNLENNGNRMLKIAIIDCGAFTTDIATLIFDMDIANREDIFPISVSHVESWPIGISEHIDSPCLQGLFNRYSIDENAVSPETIELAKRALYAGEEYMFPIAPQSIQVGHTEQDKQFIHDIIRTYCDTIWDNLSQRFAGHEIAILTGGGFCIQQIQKHITQKLKENGAEDVIHFKAESLTGIPPTGPDSIVSWESEEDNFGRLTTALGGASIALGFNLPEVIQSTDTEEEVAGGVTDNQVFEQKPQKKSSNKFSGIEINTPCFFAICTNGTEKECIEKGLFGDREWRLPYIKTLKKGDICFLQNIVSNQLLGVFMAESEVQLNIDHEAWGGQFPAQVRVKLLDRLQRIDNASDKLAKILEMREIRKGEQFSYKIPSKNMYGPEITQNVLSLFGTFRIPKQEPQKFVEIGKIPEIILDDVAGLENVKRFIYQRILAPFEDEEIAYSLGLRIGGGMLLFGPPGTGKTLIAMSIAKSIQAKFIDVSPSVIVGYPGEAEKRLENIFVSLDKEPRAVIFFDEAEWILSDRTDQTSSVMQRITPVLLAQLSRIFKQRTKPIVVIAATNKPERIDTAFLRPGRFDKCFHIGLPDIEARVQIVDIFVRNRAHKLSKDDIYEISERLDGYSGADIEHIIEEAAFIAFERRKTGGIEILKEDILSIIDETSPSVTKDVEKNILCWMEERGIKELK